MLKFCPFFAGKTKWSTSSGLLDHAVEGHRPLEAGGRGVVVVGLGLDHVAEGREPEGVGIGGRPLVVGGDDAELALLLGGQGDPGRLLAQDVADQADVDRLAELAAGRDRRGRPGEVADVEPVEARIGPGVGALADLDQVGPVLRGDDRGERVLQISAASSLEASSNRLASMIAT